MSKKIISNKIEKLYNINFFNFHELISTSPKFKDTPYQIKIIKAEPAVTDKKTGPA
jgi:hypothetical protein